MESPPQLASPTVVRALLLEAGIRPRKRWGQNFLIDGNILDRVVKTAELSPTSRVLEIGSGLGSLTRKLAEQAERVLTVELDRGLCKLLRARVLPELENVHLLEEDFLKLDLEAALAEHLGEPPYVAVANLPYSISSPAIVRLLRLEPPMERIVLMLQREVCDRLTAQPGDRAYGSPSVFAQLRAEVKRIAPVSRHCFYPEPEVDSTIVRFIPRREPLFPDVDLAYLEIVVRGAFGKRRKTLRNSLSNAVELSWNRSRATQVLEQAGVDPTRRAETLTLAEFAAIARVGYTNSNAEAPIPIGEETDGSNP